jgi:hypothetical protein
MVPYRCIIGGCYRHVGMDTTARGRVWHDMAREETETTPRNRNNFLGRHALRRRRILPPPHHQRRHEPRASAAHPRPEAPPPAEGADDLGPATAESSAHGRAGSSTVPRAVCTTLACVLVQNLYEKRDRRRAHRVGKSEQPQARAPARTGPRGSAGWHLSLALSRSVCAWPAARQ